MGGGDDHHQEGTRGSEAEGAEAFLKDFLPTLLCVRMSDIHKAWQAASMKHFALFYAAGCCSALLVCPSL